MQYDIITIGGGPAAMSAAVYALRGGLTALIIAKDGGALDQADRVDNYFALPHPMSGREILAAGRAQVIRHKGEFITAEAAGISTDGECFSVSTTAGTYTARAVLLATGKPHKQSGIPGLDAFVGRGASRCAVCDGFFFRGQRVGVVGSGAYACEEAAHLTGVAGSVTIFTDGGNLESPLPDGVDVDLRKIARTIGDDRLTALVFDDGAEAPLDGVFIAQGRAGAGDFARTLGIITDGGGISVDNNGMTNYPGIFAAGDCTGALAQIAAAAYTGAVAGLGMIKYVKSLKRK